MEGQPSCLEVRTPDFAKCSAREKGHPRPPHKRLRDPVPAEDQAPGSRSHKKRKRCQPLEPSTLEIPELCDEAGQLPPLPKKKKKKKKEEEEEGRAGVEEGRASVEEAAGVACVLVDKENSENAWTGLRRDVDVIYIDVSKEQKAAEEPKGEEPLSLTESQENEADEQRDAVKARKKKKKRQREVAAREAAQESPCGSLGEPRGSSAQPEPLPSGRPGSDEAPQPASAEKSKSKRKKKKSPESWEPEPGAGPERPESACAVPSEAGLEEDGKEPRSRKKKPKKKPSSQPACEEEGSAAAAVQGSEAKYLSEDSRDSDPEVDLDVATRQLQEFIPDISERAATTIRRMYRDDLGRFKEFKAQGVAIKFGKFSAKENRQLERNVQDFLALTGIESADKLLYTDRYPEEKSVITDLKRKFAFRVHIGKGIARPWKLVYYRAKKMFDVNNYKGRYSKGEMEKLKIYHSLHGNDWKKIGEMVARSSLSVALKFSQISSERNHGPWSKAETQKLIKAVEEVILKKMSAQELQEVDARLQEQPEGRLSIVREKLYKGISWVEVEAKVETRNWMQCKSKWTEILTKRMTNGRDVYRGVNALQAKINLIERLYEINVEDANEVDWEDLASTIGDVPPSYVQSKFYKLKATCVPFWQKKTFPEIVDYLYETSLPLLKEKLEKKVEKNGAEVQTPATPRQVFLFRDIFYQDDSSEGEDADERT